MVGLALLEGCAAPAGPTVESLAGCYALGRSDSPGVSLRQAIPDTLRFDTATATGDRGAPTAYPRRLRILSRRPLPPPSAHHQPAASPPPVPLDWEHAFVLTAWRFAPPDSVEAALHQNLGPSWRLHLRARRDGLRGVAEYYDDAGGAALLPVIAARIDCPVAKPKHGASAG